jgi:predicted PurR-regulated permease PerM
MGILNNYLIKSPLLNNPDGDYNNVISQIDNINSGLGGMNNSMNTDIAGNILSQQGNVNTIVDTEMNRLNQKQQSIDSALTTQKRMLLMNDSYLKRQKVYLRIMVAIVIGLVILLLCKFLSAYFGDDENTNVLIAMVSILVIVAVIIYCGWAYVMMLRRDPIYFDQLHYLPDNKPITLTGKNDVQLISAPNTNVINTCIGSACCSQMSGTVWDISTNACIKEGFASVKRTRPYEQNEMDNYSMYKL